MNPLPRIDMAEVSRLTREGRLEEAMAVLRRALPGGPAAAPPRPAGNARPGPAGDTPPTLDMVPPSAATGGAWTSPPAGGERAAGRSGSPGQPGIPEALRGFLGRMGQPAAAGGPFPSPLPAGARFEEHSFANEAGSRTYKLYVPASHGGRTLPLVVMLHGCTQTPDDFAAGTRMNELAERQGLLVAYPAQAPSANASRCWNWFSADDQQRDRGEPSILAGITRRIMREHAVAPGRVYVAGLSAGGAAAAVMGSAYPDLYAAIGVHSGLACGAAGDLPSALAAMRQGGPPPARGPRRRGVPAIVFHGDRDTTVHPVNGDRVIAQAKAGSALRTALESGEARGGLRYTRTVHAEESGRAMLEQWVLHGAGHAWSGGSAAGSFTEPRGPDASREMMRFFLQHATTAAF
ncbi:extracellular catalytic domain type 1 short-chain-length polyhydroxyalkanoate depolymerase [Marinimicrococcus flavescens]|uniref:PHB depolymerase family esterase n=1 Tax=Marinimicrococcus flavescens TaxID=3031815 RepID=A0AAP3UZ50_9PROT|nr:PHB depolymerase family esterase [Marinimicrococcus flavescens]